MKRLLNRIIGLVLRIIGEQIVIHDFQFTDINYSFMAGGVYAQSPTSV